MCGVGFPSTGSDCDESPEEVLANDRLKLWHSTTDARAVQVALMLSNEEYATFVESNKLPSDYLTRKRPDDYSKIPGLGKLQGTLVPDLNKPLTVESLVEQYEARAREVHRKLGWYEESWQGLAELWAVVDLEIMRMTLAIPQNKGRPELGVLQELFKVTSEERKLLCDELLEPRRLCGEEKDSSEVLPTAR
jgi:hypothetical protein